MPDLPEIRSPWRWAMLPLWGAFFFTALAPELAYFRLRELGHVVTQSALINSPYLLYFGLAGFITWFAYARCREFGMDSIAARARAFSVLIYALIGFFPLAGQMAAAANDLLPFYRYLSLAVLAIKALCWAYLALLVLRYHFTSGAQVFAAQPSLFPSTRQEKLALAVKQPESNTPDPLEPGE